MRPDIKLQVNNLPDVPGVYFFKCGRQILYIGKATSLRSRVRSYFRDDLAATRSEWIARMIDAADRIDYEVTDSVLEALILESHQIKKHQPPYNLREKDDKSFLYVVITDESYPRVLAIRGRSLPGQHQNSAVFTHSYTAGSDADQNFDLPVRYVFGPFPHGGELRDALRIIRKIFPFRTTCVPETGKLCFDAQIGLCPGVCGGQMGKLEYRRLIRQLSLFFQGRKAQLLKQLEREMGQAAKKLDFEQAAEIKRKIFALKHIQDVSLMRRRLPEDFAELGRDAEPRFEAYDVAHLSGTSSVGVMVVAYGEQLAKDQYRKFKLRGRASQRSDDTGNLYEILSRRLKHPEWPLPTAIVVDGGRAQINLAERTIKENKLLIPVIAVVKDERHRARAINGPAELVAKYRRGLIALNAEAHRFAITYHRKLRGRLI